MAVIHKSVCSGAGSNIIRAVLPNGMVVLITENPSADIVASRILVRGGGRQEVPTHAGVAHLLTTVLTKGTARFSSQEIAEQVESVGASLGTEATADYCLLGFKTVSEDFEAILRLAAEIMRSPTFPEDELALEQRLTVQGIRSMYEQPFAIAYNQLRAILHDQAAYSVSVMGTEETVSRLDRDAILHYYNTHFRPDNIVISIAGRIHSETALAAIENAFGDWQAKNQAIFQDAIAPPIPLTTHCTITPQDTQQAIVMLGYQAASVHSADYISLKLLSTYLGNGLSSRLFVELREKQGLAYDVSAIYPTRVAPSHFVVYMGTAPQNVSVAIDGLRREVKRLCQTKLTPDELQVAKNKLLGQYALGKQTNGQLAQLYGWYEVLELGIDFDHRFQQSIHDLSLDQLHSVAHKYLDQEGCLSLVGPEEAIASF
ncbi:MAG: insulinase family protein [Merismopedia sp. SIO2A8]|nr:insulinase family protein [Symploca sp. SIO2B6]NET49030.1 insulinase family protein [Merismopedia sp. SIO2A8]